MTWFDEETTAFVEAGCALIIGTTGPDGEPCAGRGWGLTVLDGPDRVRLLLDGADTSTIDHLAGGAPVAVTAACVRTLRSVQMKGRSVAVEEAAAADVERSARYCEAMFRDIHETDFTPMELIERLRPRSLAACVAVVDAVFDQTPGPNAGERLPGR